MGVAAGNGRHDGQGAGEWVGMSPVGPGHVS